MKKLIYFTAGIFFISNCTLAQVISTTATSTSTVSTTSSAETPESLTVSLTDLQTPVSPGFVLADQTPSSINRPTNPRGFVASLLSLNSGGALEVTPYWIIRSQKRDTLSYTNYIKKVVPFWQTLSISATSFKSDTGSYISAGIKTTLIRVYSKKMIKKVNSKVDTLEGLLGNLPIDLDTAAISKTKKELKELDKRPVFVVEIAGAILGYSPNNGYEQLNRSRLGGWANIAYKPHDQINIIGLIRYINNKFQKGFSEDANLFDTGLSFGFENKLQTLSVNSEYIHRNNFLTKTASHRLAIVANYKLTEQLYFVGSLGKNFDQVNNIIALFGINLGLSNSKAKIK
jgi:hypothetical protein